MPIETSNKNFTFTELTTHFHFACFGSFSPQDFLNLINGIKLRVDTGRKKILVDITQVKSELGVLDRYSLGVIIATELPGRSIAVVAEKSKITKVAENTAVNRGADLFVTHDEPEALQWLLAR